MKALIIYDSNFGHTKIIAESIARGIGESTTIKSVSDFSGNDFLSLDLLIVGSPIIGWKPSERMLPFLENLKEGQLKGIKAASFDTRVKLFIHGDAAKKISARLKECGAEIITEPQPFYVKGQKGPLFEGEINRAEAWGKSLQKFIK